jgi:hypothetical protein
VKTEEGRVKNLSSKEAAKREEGVKLQKNRRKEAGGGKTA